MAKAKTRQPVKDIGRMTEEEMLQMAMQNSLESENGASSSRPERARPGRAHGCGSPGQGQGPGCRGEPGGRPGHGRLARLRGGTGAGAGSGTVAAVTFCAHRVGQAAYRAGQRASFDDAHPVQTRRRPRQSGRFATSDPVVRIYEWLKAEPLEDKGASEFELKMMPQGRDLIQDLDKTIEEGGPEAGHRHDRVH